MTPNLHLFIRLREVVTLRFTSRSHTETGWRGNGRGLVRVSEPGPGVLVFTESGSWQQDDGKEMRFTNIFRWTQVEDRIHLEHLRYGEDKPVFLFEMAVDSEGNWRETAPHPCRDDCYRATLQLRDEQVFVNWLVRGPDRDEVIDYVYI